MIMLETGNGSETLHANNEYTPILPKKHGALEEIRPAIRGIVIRNFKSIQEVNIRLENGVNILIGPNGAGKTNILEAIYFLRKALIDDYETTPYLPHIEWWDPLNIFPERSPAAAPSYVIHGETVWTYDNSWRFSIRYEYIVDFALSKNMNTVGPYSHRLKINSNNTKLGHIFMEIEVEPGSFKAVIPRDIEKIFAEAKNETRERLAKIVKESRCRDNKCIYKKTFDWDKQFINPISTDDLLQLAMAGIDIVALLYLYMMIIQFSLESIVFIKHPDIGRIREPQRMLAYKMLRPRAENLVAVLYRLRREKSGFFEEMGRAIKRFFPGTRLDIDVLPDGRATLMMYEGDKAYPAPCIPDGLIKLVTLKTAMALEPSLLLIDEIENSMHAEMLRYVYDDLNAAPYPVLAATHSPHIVDLAGPERTLLVKRDPEKGTVVERISEPEKLMEELRELGLSFSDYIYR